MSQFYARYVPEPTPSQQVPEPAKRKRPDTKALNRSSKKQKVEDLRNGDTILEKYSSSRTATKENESAVIKKRKMRTKTAEKTEAEKDGSTKHAALLSKYSKSKDRAQHEADDSTSQAQEQNTEETTEVEEHGLEPIPQPEAVAKPHTAPSFNTRPDWLNNPIRANTKSKKSFETLCIAKPLLQRLHAQGKKDALPIQAAVLPLLLRKKLDQRNDICVSAATGSGKTLAYVLPILQNLKGSKLTKLRAVILAPTRTLVRQVSQVCESCASGLGLTIATAEGSRALKEEQRLLVEEVEMYNPEASASLQETAVNWMSYSLRDTLEDVQNRNLVDSIDMVTAYRSKADILITTPGRLVEHLKSTKGFSLKDVQWFVVDEADRLLNESYQEWTDSVMPALVSQEATEIRDRILQRMRMDVPKRRVTKVLLSATMTSDISQLMQLDLRSPRLVVVGNEQIATPPSAIDENVPDPTSETDGLAFQLPQTLSETVIALKAKQGPDKPLLLLELLRTHIWTPEKAVTLNGIAKDDADSHEDSTDESSSDGSSSASDTGSTSSLSSSTSTSGNSTSSGDTSPIQNAFLQSKVKKRREPSSSRQRALVFTRSTESAARLARLLVILAPEMHDKISTYTSGANSKGSLRRTLTDFKNGKISVLISTDLASRGLNIESLEHVINYDIPANALTYVHRVGRTARAGLNGHAWSLVEHRQGKWFWEEIGGKGVKEPSITRKCKIKRMEIKVEDDGVKDRYDSALLQLGEDVKGQKNEK